GGEGGPPRGGCPARRTIGLAAVTGGGEQAIDLLDAEHARQLAAALGPLDDRGRIVAAPSLCVEEAIELADRRQPARDRSCSEFARGQMAQIATHALSPAIA